jgi:valyl-tRNA synthetase
MSKSKGNVVTPQAMLDSHGSDAVRYWAASSKLGTDAAFDPENPKLIKIGRRLAIKVLNASKFAYSFDGESGAVTDPLDVDMLHRLAEVIDVATTAYNDFDHARALEVTESFFWTFCDDYLELVKHRAYQNAGDPGQVSAVTALRLALDAMLRLFAPVLSFATEEVWSWRHEESIHTSPWPTVAELQLPDNAHPGSLALASEALITLRRAKTDRQLPQRAAIATATLAGPGGLSVIADDLCAVAAIESLELASAEEVALTAFEPADTEPEQ